VARLSDIASSLGRPVYTGLKKNEGSCTPSLGYYILSPLASHTLKWMHVCAGGRGTLPLPPWVSMGRLILKKRRTRSERDSESERERERERERALLGTTSHNGGSMAAPAARTPHQHERERKSFIRNYAPLRGLGSRAAPAARTPHQHERDRESFIRNYAPLRGV
jgi:hypothetical protein